MTPAHRATDHVGMRNSSRGTGLTAVLAALVLVVVLAAPAGVAQAQDAGSITGTVTVPPGYDVRAVQVTAKTLDGGTSSGPVWTQPDGSFSIGGLAPGAYHVFFGTYWSDMSPCSYGRDRWWTAPGVPPGGSCTGDTLTGVGEVTVAAGTATDLGSNALLTTFPTYRSSGRLVAPEGQSTAGVQAELWQNDESTWLPSGWQRLTSIPVQTLDASGTFAFDLVDGPWDHLYAIRFVDPSHGYTFSFGTAGLTNTTPGLGGADFAVGSVGLLGIPRWTSKDSDLGTHQLTFELDQLGGGVAITGSPEWGRTLVGHSTVRWADPTVTTDFQWLSNGVVIDGAIGPTYVLDAMDDGWGSQISIRAVPHGPWSYNGPPIDSAPMTIVNTTPLAVVAPSVSGTAKAGETLTATTGTWRPSAATYTYAYQWFRGTTAVPGAHGASFALTTADVGQRVSAEVTASRPPDCSLCATWFEGPGTARSTATAVVVVATPTVTPPFVKPPVVKPPVTTVTSSLPRAWVKRWSKKAGKGATVGTTVRATSTVVTKAARKHAVTVRYRWTVAGKKVSKATGTKLRVTTKYRHKKVVLTATVSAPGYRSIQRKVSFGTAR